jgi:bifunctional non-homologous end joining protein LigD
MNTIQKISLFCKEGSSDKEYNTQLMETVGGYIVNFQYGRRGSSLTPGSKTLTPVSLETATKIYNKLIAEKMGKGYKPGNDSGAGIFTSVAASVDVNTFIPHLLMPILEETELEKYLRDDNYIAQEKKDGHHKTLKRIGTTVSVRNKKGKSIEYSKELEKILIGMKHNVHLDVEAIGDTYHAFDIMEYNNKDLKGIGYLKRIETLQEAMKNIGLGITPVPIAIGYTAKKTLYDRLKKEGKEGIVFKQINATYQQGVRNETMVKFKFYATLSARVASGREGKRSIGLELLEGNKWIPVGNCTIGGTKPIPLIGSICEIKYLYAYKGGSLYQPSFKELRTDVDASECLINQVKYKSEED